MKDEYILLLKEKSPDNNKIILKLLILLYEYNILRFNPEYSWVRDYYPNISFDGDIKCILNSPRNTIVNRPYRGQLILSIGGEQFLDVQEYKTRYLHLNKYTLHINIIANPDMICNVTCATYEHIPSESFEQVIIKNARFPLTDIFISEMYRMMKVGAKCCDELGKVFFTKHLNYIEIEPCPSVHIINNYPDIFNIVSDGIFKCDFDEEDGYGCTCNRSIKLQIHMT